jgi:hypothetical protein
VDAAGDGSLVLVTNGTYVPASEITVTNGITLRSVNDAPFTTVDGIDSNRCFYLGHVDALLDGFTVTRGRTDYGGGVYLRAGTVQRCTIISNTVRGTGIGGSYIGYGAGVYLDGGGLVTNCTLTGNSANYGGAAYCDGGGSVKGCVIGDNDAVNGTTHGTIGGSGGGVYLNGGGVVDQCEISGNWAEFYGGGAYSRAGGEIQNCTVTSNAVKSSASSEPRHYPNGGGIYCSSGTVVNCEISANSAGFEGGGLYCTSSGTVQNCTIVGNTNRYYGGGGLYSRYSTVRNTISYFNGGNEPGAENWSATNSSVSHCCTTPLPTGTGNTTNGPQFVSITPPDYHLSQGSPCIDSGTAVGSPDHDLDGVPRPLDGDGNSTTEFDMGAYEFVREASDSDNDGITDGWEVKHGLDPTADDAGEDPDGDGMDNGGEHTSDTDPLDEGDCFTAEAPAWYPGAAHFVFSWGSSTGRVYTVVTKTDLSLGWGAVAGQVQRPGTGSTMSYTNTAPSAGPEYYGVKVEFPD